MSYFSLFPAVKYPVFEDKTNFNYLCNIALRIVNKTKVVDDRSIFYDHLLRDGERIENIAYNYYGSSEYYWTILLINNIFDINYDIPLSYDDFNNYLIEKYGSMADAVAELHYFIRPDESEQNFIEVTQDLYHTYPDYSIDSTVPEVNRGVQMRYTKTAYDLEVETNEAKREIKLINKVYIDEFVKSFIEQL